MSWRRVDYFSFAFILGGRYIPFQDRISFDDGLGDDYSIRCKNRLWGGQVGFDLEYNPSLSCTLVLDARFGVYLNSVQKHVILRDLGNTVTLVNNTYKKNVQAYSTEFTPSIIFRGGSAFVTLGFDYLVVYNIGYAPRQIKPSRPFCKIFAKNNLRLDGFFIGGGLSY